MHHARATLKELGYRLTPQRVLIWETLRADGGHMTAEQVAAEVHRTLPEVNLSTVYRTLELLVRLDLVRETRLGEAHAYYEVEDGRAHQHLVCTRCGAIAHIDAAVFGTVADELRAASGFEAQRLEATVYGVCADCALRDRSATRPPTLVPLDTVTAQVRDGTTSAGDGDAHP